MTRGHNRTIQMLTWTPSLGIRNFILFLENGFGKCFLLTRLKLLHWNWLRFVLLVLFFKLLQLHQPSLIFSYFEIQLFWECFWNHRLCSSYTHEQLHKFIVIVFTTLSPFNAAHWRQIIWISQKFLLQSVT